MPSKSRTLAGLLGAIATASQPGAALADWPIVESRGPSARHFPVGSSLPGDAVILLRARDMLVLERSVGPVTYRGPGYFRLSDEPRIVKRRRRVGAPVVILDLPPAPLHMLLRPPLLEREGSESVAEQAVREGFIICPGHPRCPTDE